METYEQKGVVPPSIVEKSESHSTSAKGDVGVDVPAATSHEITKEEFDEMRKIVEPFAHKPDNVGMEHSAEQMPDFDAAPVGHDNADNEARRKLIRKISAFVSVFKNECRDLGTRL